MDSMTSSNQKLGMLYIHGNVQKRKNFESQPAFIKAGLYYLLKFRSVRCQNFYQKFVVSELLATKARHDLSSGKHREAARNLEQVKIYWLFE